MNGRTREESLANWLKLGEDDLPRLLHAVRHPRKKIRLGAVLYRLADHARVKAMHAYFVEHDIDKSKQNFYLAELPLKLRLPAGRV
jgi:hypothetical protein